MQLTPRERIQRMIDEVCLRHLIDKSELLGSSRYRKAVKARRDVIVKLDAMGLSSVRIGQIVNRDHTSVLALLGRLTSKKAKWRDGDAQDATERNAANDREPRSADQAAA
jgi:chromosomal replication initiation ATPase DnaA